MTNNDTNTNTEDNTIHNSQQPTPQSTQETTEEAVVTIAADAESSTSAEPEEVKENAGYGTLKSKKQVVVLAFDFGVKKMGVAIGNTLTKTARPLKIVDMDNGQPHWDDLFEMISDWQAKQIIVGLPLNMDGTESMLAKRATKFARRLAHKLMEQKLAISVYMHDERLSSVEARALAWEEGFITNEEDPIDDISAMLLLNSYFEDPTLVIDLTAYKV